MPPTWLTNTSWWLQDLLKKIEKYFNTRLPPDQSLGNCYPLCLTPGKQDKNSDLGTVVNGGEDCPAKKATTGTEIETVFS